MVIWKVVAALCATRGSQVLRTMVESSSSSVRKLCTGEPSFEFASGDFVERGLGSLGGGDRIAMFFALQVLVGKHQLAPRLAHVPLDIVGEHA